MSLATGAAPLPAAQLPGVPGPVAARRPPPTGKQNREGRAAYNSHRFAHPPRLLLIAILTIQLVLSLRLVWSTTAFTDEALYLWAGHLEIAHWLSGTPLPPSIPAFPSYFSGAPVIYPPLGAIADAYGGLAGARLLSLAFMLGTTLLLHATASRLFGRAAGISAAAIFAFLGPTQFLGAFATFDPLALFLLALGTWLVVRAQGWFSEPLLIAAGLSLALADATKYGTTLWDPVVIVLAALTFQGGGRLRGALRGVRLSAYVAVPLVLALLRFGGPAYLRGVMFTTLARSAARPATSSVLILEESFSWLWLVFALAVIAVIISFNDTLRTRLLCIALTAAMLLAPLHQAQIHTLISLHKHVDFGAWFGAIPAGYALARAEAHGRAKGWRILAGAAGVVIFGGVLQANTLYSTGWPDMAGATAILSRLIPARHCPCLVTADNVVDYYLLGKIPWSEDGQIAGPAHFSYWDEARQREISGATAYTQALREHYFSVVELDPAENPALYRSAVAVLTATADYRKVATIPIQHWPGKVVEIWVYEPPRDQQKGSGLGSDG